MQDKDRKIREVEQALREIMKALDPSIKTPTPVNVRALREEEDYGYDVNVRVTYDEEVSPPVANDPDPCLPCRMLPRAIFQELINQGLSELIHNTKTDDGFYAKIDDLHAAIVGDRHSTQLSIQRRYQESLKQRPNPPSFQ